MMQFALIVLVILLLVIVIGYAIAIAIGHPLIEKPQMIAHYAAALPISPRTLWLLFARRQPMEPIGWNSTYK